MTDTSFIRDGDFAWFLRVMMAMADIRPQELSEAVGVPVSSIYDLRCRQYAPTDDVKNRLLDGIEQWCPGTLEMMRAAETARIEIRDHT